MPNMWTQTDDELDFLLFCDNPECEIHSGYVMDANTRRRIRNVAIGVGVVTAGVGAVVAAPFVIAAAGFGAAGVVAGSAAAAVQSWIGSVAAGSLFASLQSAGVLGLAATTNVAVGAVAGGGVLLAARRNVQFESRGTQTVIYCRYMLERIRAYQARQ